jgi:hypothetical protein
MPRRQAIEVIEESYTYPKPSRAKPVTTLRIKCSARDHARMQKRAEYRGVPVERWALDILVKVARAGERWDLVTWSAYRPRRRASKPSASKRPGRSG